MTKPLNKYIDHTLLKPEATQAEVEQILQEALQYDFASVCINPYWVKLSAETLKNSDVNVCTVIGFPLGATTTASKVAEAKEAIENGAVEVDMVLNIGELRSGHDDAVQADIAAVATAAHQGKAILKVIIETALLTDAQKVTACQLAQAAQADFVKTSTGFSTSGAKAADVALMRKTVGSVMGVKAAGGIHSLADARALIAAGATRLGASAGVKIMQEARAEEAK